MNEPAPTTTTTKSAIVRVDYAESSWRDTVTKCFREICSLLSHAKVSASNIHLGLNALYRIAAIASISAKRTEWAVEQEFRHVTLVPEKARHQLRERDFAGRTIQYLPVSVRAEGKRIALAEVIVGAHQDAEDARQRLKVLLADNGYEADSPEYPKITVSQVRP